jgi:uncharacterized protein (TIGR03382 family)
MGTPLDCDDRDACTADSCAEPDGCQHEPIAGCCRSDSECDDGDACTTDACASNRCRHDPIADCGGADGGMPTDDAGSTDRDAGMMAGADAGTGTDAGMLHADGAADDAGLVPRRPTSCFCRVPWSGTGGDGGPAALAVLGWLFATLFRRRGFRRRGRGQRAEASSNERGRVAG